MTMRRRIDNQVNKSAVGATSTAEGTASIAILHALVRVLARQAAAEYSADAVDNDGADRGEKE